MEPDTDPSAFARLEQLATVAPPAELAREHGGERFHVIGRKWVDTFIRLGAVRPNDRVLDVGCGAGRMAIALARYLAGRGTYDGFDVSRADVSWCKKEIEPRWPGSRFRHVDVKNSWYNRSGSIDPEDFSFPYDAERFDFIFLTSVFTHMLPAAMENYLREVVRVLRTGGRCLITYFLINDRTSASIAAGDAIYQFAHRVGPTCRSQREDSPEKAVAYDEDFIRRLYVREGLEIQEPISFGYWSRAYDFPDPRDQDIVVAVKA
jgi:ubiquinone/menaquinone biosynthesis C-methylase UbiE